VGFVAARRNVDDGFPFNPSDMGIVKAVPSVAHLLEAVVVARVHRAPTVDDHATEMVLSIFRLWMTKHRGTQIVVDGNGRGEPDMLWMLAESLRCWLEHTVIKSNSQAGRAGQEAGALLANRGPEKLGFRLGKVSSEKVLSGRHGSRRARQGKDPDVRQTGLIIRQGVPPLTPWSIMPGPRCTIPGSRRRIPVPRWRCTKVRM
jgi:hypothetical protein